MIGADEAEGVNLPDDLSLHDACLLLGTHSLHVRAFDEQWAAGKKPLAYLSLGMAMGLESTMDLFALPYAPARSMDRVARLA